MANVNGTLSRAKSKPELAAHTLDNLVFVRKTIQLPHKQLEHETENDENCTAPIRLVTGFLCRDSKMKRAI